MKKCKVCEEEGKTSTFKDGRGLNLHLMTKHKIKPQEYKDMYGKAATANVPETENEEPAPKEGKEGSNNKSTNNHSSPNVKDFQYIKEYSVVVFEGDDIREIKGIGTIETNDSSFVSILVMNNRGKLVPPQWISEQYTIFSGKPKKIKKRLKKDKEKKKRKLKNITYKSKEKGQPIDQESGKKLVKELQELQESNEKEK